MPHRAPCIFEQERSGLDELDRIIGQHHSTLWLRFDARRGPGGRCGASRLHLGRACLRQIIYLPQLARFLVENGDETRAL